MYLVGKGHEHLGPGTSMVQFIEAKQGEFAGLGFTPEFAADCSQMGGRRGLGCGCTKPCNGCGLGLFESGTDISGWSWQEYAIAGVAAYAAVSMLFTTRSAVEGTRQGVRRARRKLGSRIAGGG